MPLFVCTQPVLSLPSARPSYIFSESRNRPLIIRYSLDIFPNGSTTIDVIGRERDPISYSGQMEIDEDSLK